MEEQKWSQMAVIWIQDQYLKALLCEIKVG